MTNLVLYPINISPLSTEPDMFTNNVNASIYIPDESEMTKYYVLANYVLLNFIFLMMW